MKKIVIFLILIAITAPGFSLPYSNPWLRRWQLEFEGHKYILEFHTDNTVTNLETGEEWVYDWKLDGTFVIFRADKKAVHNRDIGPEDVFVFKVEFSRDQTTVEGYDETSNVYLKGRTAPV